MLRGKLTVNNVVQMAHDIRSPLFALQTVLEAPGEFNEKKKTLLMMAARRLQEIADSILEENKSSQEVNLNTLIAEIVNEKQVVFPNFNFHFTSLSNDISHKLCPVELKRILSNLINNSIEACECKSGFIQVSLEKSNGVVKIFIRDNGKGIPLSRLPFIFGRSFGKSSGNGLGLAHAKKYIESIGGNLEICSSANGTEVYLAF